MKQTYCPILHSLESIISVHAKLFCLVKQNVLFAVCAFFFLLSFNPSWAQTTNYLPVASNVTASTITTLGRQKIEPLLAFDAEGPVKSFTLHSVPSKGAIYIGSSGGNALTAGQNLTTAEVLNLYYLPPTFLNIIILLESGIYSFQFSATDSNNATSNVATYSLPVGNTNRPATPTPATIMTDRMSNSGGQAQIRNLMATGGTASSYRITSLPNNTDGTLYTISSASGLQTPVSELGGGYKDLTLEEAKNLWFAPASDFKGMTSFTYAVRSAESMTYSSSTSYFIPIVVASEMLPLPIELVEFSGVPLSSGGVNLSWVVATERNNAYFEIERSIDMKHFAVVGRASGRGNTSISYKYFFKDLGLKIGTYYYRLKQVDFNDAIQYSKTVVVEVSKSQTTVSVYPNPTKGKLNINFCLETTETVMIQVLDIRGQEQLRVKQTIKSGQSIYEFSLEGLKPGFYVVRITGNSLRYTDRVFIE